MSTAAAHSHASRSPAPWAEVVPHYGPVTVDILLELPEDGYVYEVVEGVLVRMAGSGDKATRLGARLSARLLTYVEAHRLGAVTGADGVYKFPGAETGLVPDLGFYSVEHLPQIADENKPIPFAPDLAVEVVSPDQSAAAMAAKARRYLRAGTHLVWVVWPQSAHIDVWRSDVLTGPVRILGISDALDGEDLIPGFSASVSELFTDPLRPEQDQQ
jgi:Uma2 family endonuclease